ncbi:hypothetical protein MA20_45645, partial [Bradyrhizobium japonicum]
QNAFIESFNARLRDELFNETLFTSLAQARAVLAAWKDDYNNARPHSALSNLTPTEYAKRNAPGPQRGGTLRYAEGSAPHPRCFTEPHGLIFNQDSSHCWMKRGAQTTLSFSYAIYSIALDSLHGLKDTQMPLLIIASGYWIIGLSLSYALGLKMGFGAVGI